jgi:hypothetical protein
MTTPMGTDLDQTDAEEALLIPVASEERKIDTETIANSPALSKYLYHEQFASLCLIT